MKRRGIAPVLLCLLLCAGGCGKERKSYRKAEDLLEESSFAQAEELFSSLGDFEDAANRTRECTYLRAKALMDADTPDFVQAVRLLREIGAYKDAIALKESLEKEYFFPEHGYRIPAPECVVPDAKRIEERGKDEVGAYRRYIYTWRISDMTAARERSDRFMEWIGCINECDGIDARPYRGGTYYISVDDVPFGMVSSHKTDNSVSITADLYDEPME